MVQNQMRGDVICEQCNIQVPQELKCKMKTLGINMTRVAVAAFEDAVAKKEAEKK